MAINPKIKQKAEDIRKKIFGSEVRESLASGLEGMSEDVESIKGRQDNVENQFQDVLDETTGKDVINGPEIIAARNGKSNLKTRLDEEHAQVTAQLQQTEQEFSSQLAQIAYSNVNAQNGTDTQKLNAFLTVHAGKTVRIPRGTYTIDSTVTVPENTVIEAKGVKIKSSSHITMLSLSSGVRINGLEIEGAGNTLEVNTGIGIHIKGADALNYKKDVVISDCYIHGIGFYGILGEFAENISIVNSKINDIGYAGVAGLSVTNMKVMDGTKIKNISPGSSGNAYGVTFTRYNTDTLDVYPQSKDCLVENCIVEDVPLWEALDTHGGINIVFSKNTIRNCKIGIAITFDGSGANPPQRCKAINNDVLGIGTGVGVIVAGADATNKSLLCEVQGNSLEECGEKGITTSGGIIIQNTIGCNVSGNVLKHCYSNGININVENTGFNINGNTVIDPQDTINNAVAGVAIRGVNNNGCISNNTLLRINDDLNTYVAERGIYIVNSVITSTKISIGTNYNNYAIPMSGVDGDSVDYGTFSNTGIKFYAGVGIPEGVIAAGVGSIYLRRDGGALTSFYVKESGTGNTGWIAK